MARIYLSGNNSHRFAFIDDEDLEKVSQYKWYLFHKKKGYAAAYINKRSILMHRFIMNTPTGMHTDHINHDTLDNRKSNLRICTHAENMANRLKPVKPVKPVTYHKNPTGTGCIHKNRKVPRGPKDKIYYGLISYKSTIYRTKTFFTPEEARIALNSLIGTIIN